MTDILYIEDEEDYQILVGRILKRAGYKVRLASSGEEGHAALGAQRPSLLLLDINLPDTDGYTICQQLRQDGAYTDLPILMLTVRRRPEEWLRGFSCGANDYLSKPFDPSGLIERVQTGLEGKTLRMTSNATPEYQLIQAAVAGNRAAFEVLIQRYRDRLSENVRQSGKSATEAEDVVSHSFLRAFEKLKEFRGEASFYTWIYRIAMNEAASGRKNQISLEDLTNNDESAMPAALAKSDTTHADMIEKEDSQRVRAVLARIPDPYGQILDLYFLRDQSYDQIARKLRIPIGTVMSRLFKARELLKTEWANGPL